MITLKKLESIPITSLLLIFSTVISFLTIEACHKKTSSECSKNRYIYSKSGFSTDTNYGELQLLNLLRDRKSMVKYVKKQDKLWNIIVEHFNGEQLGHKIRWNNEPLKKPIQYISDHHYPSSPNDKCFIRLRHYDVQGNPINGENLWSALFYEFWNLENSKEFDKLYRSAIKGNFTKSEWIEQNTRLEYQALKRNLIFYKNVWLPHLKTKGIESNSYYWSVDLEPDYEMWINNYNTNSDGDYSYWAKYYDSHFLSDSERK